MKLSGVSKVLLVGLALVLATSAFAANKGSLVVSSPVSVAGKQLSPGEYSVKWEGTGPSVDVNIMQGKNVVATVPARVVDLDRTPTSNSAVVKSNDDGSRALSQIRFSGKKQALEIGDQGGGAQSGSSSK